MSIAQPTPTFKEQIEQAVRTLTACVEQAAQQGRPIHEVEQTLWKEVLQLGRCLLGSFLAQTGNGDMGETIPAPDGGVWQRLPQSHRRRYVSVFGVFELSRVVYGSRESQKIGFIPLDNRLQLPASAYSYLLQDWAQGLSVESAFGQVQTTLERLLGLRLSVDSLERMTAQMAEQVEDYRSDRPRPPVTEGEVIVASADGKGIVMRRSVAEPAPPAHRGKGDKASHKRMAIVATVYTVDRYVRTPEEVVAALFHDVRDGPAPRRPAPQHKHVWASLAGAGTAETTTGITLVHEAIMDELVQRNRVAHAWVRPLVCLYDGQEALWDARQRALPAAGIDVLDFLHVTPRLWAAAHLFHREGSAAAEAFVRQRCLRLLRGEAAGVIQGLRRMGTQHRLTGNRRRTLERICAYLGKNRPRMRYDEYLAAGYPIASGVIEGACRHLVKDRMERAGMHWTPAGAQAMLDVRSVHVDGEWQAYQAYRIERETALHYPHRHLAQGPEYRIAC